MSDSYTLNQLKNLASDTREISKNIKSIANTIDEGWKGHEAMKYLIELDNLIYKVNTIAMDIDDVTLKMDRDMHYTEKDKV